MRKLYDVLVVGELNLDLILDKLDKLPEIGKEVLARRMTLTLGSSSAIFASNISSLGNRVAFIGKIGKDKFGEIVLESLQEKDVDVSMVKIDPNLETGITIVLNIGQDRANTTFPGAMDHLTIDDISADDLSKSRHLHFSSCFLQPGMGSHLGSLFKKAKKLGLSTSFDMQWDPHEKWDLDAENILPYVDIFLPNEKELMLLTQKSNLDEAIDSVKEYVNILAIKRGDRGSIVYCDGKLNEMPSFLNLEFVDAIGAGDNFNAGFIHKYIAGGNMADCQKIGNLAGAISTMAAGGTNAYNSYEAFKAIAKQKFGIEI